MCKQVLIKIALVSLIKFSPFSAPKFLFLIPIFIACCVCNEMSDEPTKAPIGCHKRLLKYRVTRENFYVN